MSGNSFGTLFRLTTFGESHGSAIGGVLEGCPAGMTLDFAAIQSELDRRRPGQSAITTSRNESDVVELLSGVLDGKTLGTPIGFIIRNKDHHSSDYDNLKDVYRPGHADQFWQEKFGFRDHRGGGRSSARETAARVVGGAIARQLLASLGIRIQAFVSGVKDIEVTKKYHELDLGLIESNTVRCPDIGIANEMIALIEKTKADGDSLGGTIDCIVSKVPAGWGAPVFDKLHAVLAHAMLSINATKGFEMEDGFESTKRFGSENNPIPSGITGGLSTGRDIVFKVAFKPVSTIAKKQLTQNSAGQSVELEVTGRHDPCVLPRAVPIVEAMAALVLADAMLLARSDKFQG
ncbi:MAG: chorismate synthase [Flavobacteriales bacterium]